MSIQDRTEWVDPAPQAVDPTTAELRDHMARIRDDLTGLLAEARRWAVDVDQMITEGDPRGVAASAVVDDVALGADAATAGVLWIDRHPDVPSMGDWSDRPGWADDVRWPSETVQPAGTADLFNPAVHDDGRPWTWAEVGQTRAVHEADVVARSGQLYARLEALSEEAETLTEDSVDWIDQADPASQPDMYAGYKLFADTERHATMAATYVQAFERDTLQAAHLPAEERPSTAAMFAASTNELLAYAEDVQQRTHGWVDAVGQVHGLESAQHRQAAAATDGVDHTVSSLRHAARDFALVDNPAADDTPAQAAPAAPGGDDRSADLADDPPDRDNLVAVGASVAADLDELAFALTSLRDETTDWRHTGAVTEAGDNTRRLEHAQNAGSELDDAVQAAHHGSWQVGDVTAHLDGTVGPELSEQSAEQPVTRMVADQTRVTDQAHDADLSALAVEAETVLSQAVGVQGLAQTWSARAYNSVHVDDDTREDLVDAGSSLDGTVEYLQSATQLLHWAADPGTPAWKSTPHGPVICEFDDGDLRPSASSNTGCLAAPGDLAADASQLAGAIDDAHFEVSGLNHRTHAWLSEAIKREADHDTLVKAARAADDLSTSAMLGHSAVRGHNEVRDTLSAIADDAGDHQQEVGAGRPFEQAAPTTNYASESVAAAEHGLLQIRSARAAEQRRDADIARWHAADRQAEAQRSRTGGREIEADLEPPF